VKFYSVLNFKKIVGIEQRYAKKMHFLQGVSIILLQK